MLHHGQRRKREKVKHAEGAHCEPATSTVMTILQFGEIYVDFFCFADAEVADVLTPFRAEPKAMPNQEEIFAECSQKRILGLLAAMLPRLKSVRICTNWGKGSQGVPGWREEGSGQSSWRRRGQRLDKELGGGGVLFPSLGPHQTT